MPDTETEELYCAGCGDRCDDLKGDTGLGPCCFELPNPWHRGRDGLYNNTSNDNYEELDEDEDEDNGPSCDHCGSTSWTITASTQVSTEERPGSVICFEWGGLDEPRAHCSDCGRDMPPYYEIEGS